MSTGKPSEAQDSSNPSTGTLMVVGLVALGAALAFIWTISP